jgi:hypothetical protein
MIHWPWRESLAWAVRRAYCPIFATHGIERPRLGAREPGSQGEMHPPSSPDVRRGKVYLLAKDLNWGTRVTVIAWTAAASEGAGLQSRDFSSVDRSQRFPVEHEWREPRQVISDEPQEDRRHQSP